jgi:hypothetical protein
MWSTTATFKAILLHKLLINLDPITVVIGCVDFAAC